MMRKLHGVLAIGVSLSLASCGSNVLQGAPASAALSAQGGEVGRYLVGFKPGAGANAQAVAKVGGTVTKSWQKLSAVAATLTPAAATKLQGDPSVEYVERDLQRSVQVYTETDASATATASGRPGLTPGAGTTVLWSPSGESTYGTVALKSPALNAAGVTGTGVAVCVADTGIDGQHPEFAGKLKGYRNFMGDGHDTAYDGNEHGTHVSGTIFAQAGHGGASLLTGMDPAGVVGVAPGINLYMARVLGDDGYGSSSGVVDGVNWCVSQLRSQGGTEDHVIVSLSLGSSEGSKTEQRAFAKAYEAGVLTVAAAGNTGVNQSYYPASYPTVMAIGAIDNKGNLADFSTFGKQVDLVAPGVDVLSTVPRGMGSDVVASAAGVAPYSSVLAGSPVTYGEVNAPLAAASGTHQLCTMDPALAGKIALISRGSCTFAIKVSNAAKSGALAAIIYNNAAGTINMNVGAQQAIPAVSITQADGESTLAAIQASGTVAGHVKVATADYNYLSGTSMATPHVAAAAALVWASKPTLSNDQLRSLLKATATDLGAKGRDDYFGNGLVNPTKAITGQ